MSTTAVHGPLDPQVRPQDDLYGHVNNHWLSSVTIPEDKGRYGVFDILREQADVDVRTLIDKVAQSVAAGEVAADSAAGKVGRLYATFLDEDGAEERGVSPLRPLLDDIAALSSTAEVHPLLGRLARGGVAGAVLPFVSTDDRQSDQYVVYLEQAGLGLPDEAYYRSPEHAGTRTAYAQHVARMLELTEAVGPGDGEAAAARVLDLETRLAQAHLDQVSNRDPVATYTKVDAAQLTQLAPEVDWSGWATALGADAPFAEVVVRQPDYLAALSEATAEVDLPTWQDWLRMRVVETYARYLDAATVEAAFDFTGRTLSGIPQQRERWRRAVAFIDASLGEAVGELYVQRHFPPAARERMEQLIAHLVRAFRHSFERSEWMSEATRGEALAKLEAFTPKVGHPAVWRDYGALTLSGELVADVQACAAFEVDRQLGKLGGPVDRDEWLITPQTVNAYYHPGMNEIVFPAAILQPPFFDAEADDADNYGGIGAVIGHEIGHGFDDAGSTFDGQGNLRDWWSEEDRAAFTERSEALVAQFDGMQSRDAPGHGVNGGLTVGENIGDIGGLAIGHAAYRLAVGEAALEVGTDGLTGDQRFFAAWARVWCGTAREAEAIRLLAIDPHSPQDLRGNACRNIDAFHDAFGVGEGDGMWLAPEKRVRIF